MTCNQARVSRLFPKQCQGNWMMRVRISPRVRERKTVQALPSLRGGDRFSFLHSLHESRRMTEEKEEEKKKLSPFTLIAGAGGSIIAMIIGAKLRTDGTIPGAAIGSVVSSGSAFLIETRSQRAHARLKARREQGKVDAHPETHPVQAQLEATLFPARERRALLQWNSKRKLAFIGGMLALCMASAVASLFVIESATGQTLHSVLTNQKQYGTTFGGYSTVAPSKAPAIPRVPVSPDSSPDASPSLSVAHSATPSASPSPTPALEPSAPYTGVSQ
jgi:hypothetical protein